MNSMTELHGWMRIVSAAASYTPTTKWEGLEEEESMYAMWTMIYIDVYSFESCSSG